MFNMSSARLWEIIEFYVDEFLGMNCQTGGLVDAIMDTLDCLIGTIIMISYYVRQLT
ncbi:hypothetical protein [Terrisporobacter petrolearius]|uniref:hypothetical protein n=1 Tax=Terrisporobacter petrolearius TaxID=1460447 RepID=UPI003B009B45